MAREVLTAVEADQAEVMLNGGTSALTRFANNYIHQNVQDTSTSARVRAVIGKKVGVAATDNVTPEGLRAVAQRAVELARLQQDNEAFPGLPGPAPIPQVHSRLPQTAECSPERRAEVVVDDLWRRVGCRSRRGRRFPHRRARDGRLQHARRCRLPRRRRRRHQHRDHGRRVQRLRRALDARRRRDRRRRSSLPRRSTRRSAP